MKRNKRKGSNRANIYFARASRSGHIDLTARIPELSHLHERKITVVGLGCLGAPSVLEFARCGIGELRIIDFDIVEAGTIVRWPFGLKSVGKLKTKVIKEFLNEHYPFTKVIPFSRRIGEVRRSEEQTSDLEVLKDALSDTDLVYDASAEWGLQHLLSDLAAELSVPYIGISMTYGAWGGVLGRIRPGKTEGCWWCFRYSLDDGSFPLPLSDPDGEVQPLGCADPTFTGAAFDSGIIAFGGVRLAVSTLTEKDENGYPSFDWDIAIINLRDNNGNAIIPSWKTFALKKHPSCSYSKNF